MFDEWYKSYVGITPEEAKKRGVTDVETLRDAWDAAVQEAIRVVKTEKDTNWKKGDYTGEFRRSIVWGLEELTNQAQGEGLK